MKRRRDKGISLIIPQNGFTLVELAIVLVILGLLVGIGAQMIGPLTKRMKLNETRQIVNSARESLLGYAVVNGYLPSDTDSNPLGKAGAQSKDAWGRELVYFADDAVEGAGVEICDVTETNFKIYICDDSGCTDYEELENIAFIVFSTGEDFNGEGTTTSASGSGSICSSYTMPSCPDGKTCFYIRIQGTCYEYAGTEYRYDDVVYYVSIFEIQRARRC
jgi:prepilin-type N-terminal cleavage/methylation domain-containing protein